VVSTLPIEPALQMGATEIIALDLDGSKPAPQGHFTIPQYIDQYLYAMNRRHVYLETALARAQGVRVRMIDFRGMTAAPIWDFRESQAMIQAGYERANRVMDNWVRTARQDSAVENRVAAKLPAMEQIQGIER